MKNKWTAFFLSLLVPGLGQLYLGQKAVGLSFLCITVGVALITAGSALILATGWSWFTAIFVGPLWIFVMISVAADAYRTASGKTRRFTEGSVPYVLFMLFVLAGPFAIPLLWQSPKFSREAKIVCTVFVVLLALLVIAALSFIGSVLNTVVEQTNAAMGS